MNTAPELIRVGTLEELRDRECIVVSGRQRPVVVFFNGGDVRAVDNRCPHMGFPLHQGTVQDGVLTCHWHHARFDLSSGCTFDLWADDVPSCPVEIRGEVVYVGSECHYADEGEHWRRRLEEGMAQNLDLLIAKSVIAQLKSGADYRCLVRQATLFGGRFRDGWASGLTILTAMANLASQLPEDERMLALYQGISHVADDCAGEEPRRDRHPLKSSAADHATLKRWLRYWITVRHREGAERTLLTALARGESPAQVADLLFSAATDRYFADTGHALDFINKAFEVLEHIGWQHASEVLPTVIRQLAEARGGEELNAWRHPLALVPLLEATFAELPELVEQAKQNRNRLAEDLGTQPLSGRDARPTDPAALAETLLGDEPAEIVTAIKCAIGDGMAPTELTKALAYAAAQRIARFGLSNEFADWITALHTFTYCNALHQAMKRVSAAIADPPIELLRGIFHGAMAVYLDRFLNVPPARLPGERDGAELESEPSEAEALCAKLLVTLDSQQRVDAASRIVARYLALRHPLPPLLATLTRGVVREDANFHTFQLLEAGVQQYAEWGDSPQGRTILLAVARYVAAHAPTSRASLQTAEIALRLHRGDALYAED